MPVNSSQTATIAQKLLNTYYLGTIVGDIKFFPGHYILEALSNSGSYDSLTVTATLSRSGTTTLTGLSYKKLYPKKAIK